MDPSQDFKSFQDSLQSRLLSTVKSVNRIAREDLEFQRTVNPDVAESLDAQSARLLGLANRLAAAAAATCRVEAPKLEDVDDVEMKWTGIVDVVDSLLERVDTTLDEYTGLVKRKDAPAEVVSLQAARAQWDLH